MKKVLVIFMLMALALPSFAQSVKQVKEQRIYLWDVTLSMKGYKGKTPDIYKDVVEFIIADINAIKDESTIIKVAPFQEGVLDMWSESATVEGKKRIIEKIKKYNNDIVTDTDIMSALTKVEREYIDKQMRNQIILLTDGKHNDPVLHDRFIKKINGGEWDKFASENNAFLRYVALIDIAVIPDFVNNNTKTLQDKFKNTLFADLYANSVCNYNIKDDKKVEINIECSQVVNLPELQFAVSCRDSIMNFEKVVKLENGKQLSFALDYDYETLKMQIPEEYTLPVQIKLLDTEVNVNQEEMLMPVMQTSAIDLVLINKPEKVLKIKIKR